MYAELDREQARLDTFYDRLDELRRRARRDLAEVRRRGAVGTPQARSERDAFATHYEDRLARLLSVEHGLAFGRLDLTSGEQHYIGRLGLSDDAQQVLLVDWRAPAAQAFYRATGRDPHGVRRRRHLRTRDRRVVQVEDDVFDLAGLSEGDRATLGGDAALLAALTARRTGRMRDIVATIQAEQDAVIREDLDGVLIVDGGPGTGKTAVALHRAAYLLYTHRDRLAASGVLVVGPNPYFLRYIEQVLPSLGETSVLLSTVEQLVPWASATATDPLAAAVLKGDRRMAELIAAAVADRQRLPERALSVPFDEHELRLPPEAVAAARARARRSRRPHNAARYTFAKALVQRLVVAAAEASRDPDLLRQRWVAPALYRTEEFRAAVDALWPRVSAAELVSGLFSSAAALQRLGGGWLGAAERQALQRPADAPWTAADLPLLDEAFGLLGDPEAGVRRAAERRERRAERRYAEEVLELTGTRGRVDPDQLSGRFAGQGLPATVAERAAEDPAWRFGHVIVDEAQELSAMAWRMLVRRCPARSMTVVGDLAQTSAPAGARSWAQVLDPLAQGRWRRRTLSVNYRTPAQIMELASDVLCAVDPVAEPPVAVREGPAPPWLAEVGESGLLAEVLERVTAELTAAGGGTVAVLVPAELEQPVHSTLAGAIPAEVLAEERLVVRTVAAAKGLEFDGVIVVQPARLPPRDLYVALTRATQRLGVVTSAALPPALHRLAPATSVRP